MRLLIDTHLLVWSAEDPARLSRSAHALLIDPANDLYFSSISIVEIAIKSRLGRPDFDIDPDLLLRGLLANDFVELPLTSAHAVGIIELPPIHKDPFDRMLIAQAAISGLTFVTADAMVGQYPGPIRLV